MLLIARRHQLPVILHCRDHGSGDAASRALIIIKSDFADLKYHRHCFDGTADELREWQALPNIVFGISGKFIRSGCKDQSVISRVPPHQLVLETDAPFLSPVSCCEVNHHWNMRTVAVAVSQCRNIPFNVLLWMVNDNALKFYGLPQTSQPLSCWGPRPR
jgi:TatD DNase family protein